MGKLGHRSSVLHQGCQAIEGDSWDTTTRRGSRHHLDHSTSSGHASQCTSRPAQSNRLHVLLTHLK